MSNHEEKTSILFFADSIGFIHACIGAWVWIHQFLSFFSSFPFSRP
jgi:hypothetical protein